MIDREMSYTTYEVVYRVKNGKKMRMAYLGDDKHTYEEVVKLLEERTDVRYLSKSITQTSVTLFD